MKEFYTVHEVAKILRLSVATVRKLVRDGEIEHARFGRAIRISESQLRNYVERQQKTEDR